MSRKLLIFSDNVVEGDWFRGLSPLLSDAEIVPIKGRGKNPAPVDSLVQYDRPDIILTLDGEPKLVLEKTREVPTGHNIGQRMARLVRAAEMHIPSIKFSPFDAMKHGKYSSKCNLNIRMLDAFQRMSEIHGVPVLAANWPCDAEFELVDDGSENDRISEMIEDFMNSDMDPECQEFTDQLRRMKRERERRYEIRPAYAMPPPSVRFVATDEVLQDFDSKKGKRVIEALSERPESVVYTIAMTPPKCKRQDPYTGTQFVYDYVWCRTGESVGDKSRNLVLNFPKITRDEWHERNPNNPDTKSGNWYLTANALIFKDGAELLRP